MGIIELDSPHVSASRHCRAIGMRPLMALVMTLGVASLAGEGPVAAPVHPGCISRPARAGDPSTPPSRVIVIIDVHTGQVVATTLCTSEN
jgi:hypothetical protein